MKIFVLGHHGMLGHVVARYLAEQGSEVLTSPERYTGRPGDKLISAVTNSDAAWIVNAIGKTDPKTPHDEMFRVNAQLPIHFKSFLRPHQRMIHASTDGVFSGRTGNYHVHADRDAEDSYGFSKILGEVIAEREKAYVIRTSIIGPAGAREGGLMNWFLKQRAGVHGYTNHFWNGITTLEWAKVCGEIIAGAIRPEGGIIQPASAEAISKFELLQWMGEIWSHRIPIEPAAGSLAINRTLAPNLRRGPIREQLVELRAWHAQHEAG